MKTATKGGQKMHQDKKIVLKVTERMNYITNQSNTGEKVDKFKCFVKITKQDRKKIKKWLKGRNGNTVREENFLKRVKQAIQKVRYNYWIASIEPSVADGKIYYSEGEDVGVGFSCNQWNLMSKIFAPERGSRQANLHELVIWYALRIVENKWTLDYVANDSSSAGNYRNAPETTRNSEKTGVRECGGYCDGQGNTYKIVTAADNYAFVGGDYLDTGYLYPVADIISDVNPDYIRYYSSGVVVLTKK